MKKIVFIELNELNFDFIQKYIQKFPNKYNNLEKIYKKQLIQHQKKNTIFLNHGYSGYLFIQD